MERGNISVSTENIFPIIKKSLYSDQEIFLRELVANAVDASQKLKHLAAVGQYEGEVGELDIVVSIDKEAKTLKISDRGVGMSGEEVKKYLNQVAFSGAEEFLKKFKELGDNNEIIGKFGLGFYSAFMVAKEVEVITQSQDDQAPAVRWICDGTTTYSMEETAREAGRGTDIILHIAEDAEEFIEEARIRQILNKYCKFLPIPIKMGEDQVNQTDPIWRKAPTDLSKEDYEALFRDLYPLADDPMFWIHLNVDYPFNLTGILYFPKIRKDIDPRKNNIQLYSRQVFITDEVSEIVPDYLMLLQGVIDSPDIPLNVSRSYLQSDSNVRKISNYITRKVADKLVDLFKEDRETYQEKWNNISVFAKYGMITDEKFKDRVWEACLVEDVAGAFHTLEEMSEVVGEKQTDKDGQKVFLYTSDKKAQDMYIQRATQKGYLVAMMADLLDSHFIGMLEQKMEQARWVRVDSDTIDKLVPKEETGEEGILLTEDQLARIKETFVKVLPREQMEVQTASLGKEELPVLITRPEFMRRMKDMAAMGGGMAYMGELPDSVNVVVNTQHPAIQGMVDTADNQQMAKELLDLALLSQNMLEGKALTDFIQRTVDIIAHPPVKKTRKKKAAPQKEAGEGEEKEEA